MALAKGTEQPSEMTTSGLQGIYTLVEGESSEERRPLEGEKGDCSRHGNTGNSNERDKGRETETKVPVTLTAGAGFFKTYCTVSSIPLTNIDSPSGLVEGQLLGR